MLNLIRTILKIIKVLEFISAFVRMIIILRMIQTTPVKLIMKIN